MKIVLNIKNIQITILTKCLNKKVMLNMTSLKISFLREKKVKALL